MDFTYGAYLGLLEELGRRFTIHPLRDFSLAPSRLYLRHDVDACPKRAIAMAREEARHGISSTYMFIPTCPLYGLSEQTLRPFVELGHEVALHFDYRTSGVQRDGIEAEVEKQCRLMAALSGQEVRSISFHRPIEQFLHGPDYLFGLVNAYSATLMDCYRSDSGGHWREDPRQVPDAPIVQLLTHPLWWGEEHQEPKERLTDYYLESGGGEELSQMLAEAAPRVWAS
jgi:hypothetical protein